MEEYLSEQEQWDAVKRWMRENTIWILAGVALAAAGLAGWQWWQARKERELVAASTLYEQLFSAYTSEKPDQVKNLATELAAKYPSTAYAEQGQLLLAGHYLSQDLPADALQTLQQVLQKTRDAELALLVRLRIARIQIAQQKADDALATLAAAPPGALAGRYAEARGDALYAKGDRAGALAAYQAAQADGATVDAELLALKINQLSRT
jgi:predicted negative regulator of RcsB-dependent stress response